MAVRLPKPRMRASTSRRGALKFGRAKTPVIKLPGHQGLSGLQPVPSHRDTPARRWAGLKVESNTASKIRSITPVMAVTYGRWSQAQTATWLDSGSVEFVTPAARAASPPQPHALGG